MEKIVIQTAKTAEGYSGACELLPGWVVAYTGDFEGFRDYVRESIDFYVEGAREDGREYPSALDGDFELVFKFDVRSLLESYRGIFSFAALQAITGINQKQLAHYASGLKNPRGRQAEKIADGLHRLARELTVVDV